MTTEAFFTELNRIISMQPKLFTHTINSENCEYGDQLYYCKNMTHCFDCLNSNDCVYVFDSHMCVRCIDTDYSNESELCYECVGARKCFNSDYLEGCENVRDSSFSYMCRDCHDVFGCANIQGKSFCIFNRQLTEQEYRETVKKYKAVPAGKILETVEKLKKQFPLTQTHGYNNENSPYGNYVYNSSNSYMCFDSSSNQNCGYLYDSGANKYCYDATFSGDSELVYEFVDSAYLFNCNFVIWSAYCNDSAYLVACANLKNCLGCVNLVQKEYCILNRQFSKEEYERVSKQILEELKTKNLGWNGIVF